MIYTVCKYFLLFMLFSFGGWLMETLLNVIRDKKVVKRGFLFGPVCPIYGFAAVLCSIVIYGRLHNVFLVFIAGFFLSFALEYVTHFVMEKLFHAMWWDYSNRRFNIKGRVYLKGLVLFGLGVVIMIELLLPLYDKLLAVLPDKALYIICFILYSLIIVDLATTIVDLKGIINILKTLQANAIGATQKGVDLTGEQMEKVIASIKKSDFYLKTFDDEHNQNALLARFKKRYPNFTLKNYKYILDLINDPPMEDKGRHDIKLYGTADSIPEAETAEKEPKGL
ncbi:MAG: putative ABC transporter permease [Eubacterium sp.]|nr:putative ABC transporter permease [Eubacterium sp.]